MNNSFNFVVLLYVTVLSCTNNSEIKNNTVEYNHNDTVEIKGKYVCGFELSNLETKNNSIWLYSSDSSLEAVFQNLNNLPITVKAIIDTNNKGHLGQYDFSANVLEVVKK